MKEIYVSKTAYNSLKKQLAKVNKTLSESIEVAHVLVDFDGESRIPEITKTKKAELVDKKAQYEQMLKESKVLREQENKNIIGLGATVTLINQHKEIINVKITCGYEYEYDKVNDVDLLPYSAPMTQKLMGETVGHTFSIIVPSDRVQIINEYKILGFTYELSNKKTK